MIVLVASRSSNMATTQEALAKLLPDEEVLLWPDPRSKEADAVVGWDVPTDLYEGMSRLKLVHSVAAGADNVITAGLAHDIPVCRIVDSSQSQGMVEYVHWGVTYFHRGFDAMARAQREHQWLRPKQIAASRVGVGIMGLGHMGLTVAQALSRAGYRARGWSRTPKTADGVECFVGREELAQFLSGCNILVCLLPLTPETRGILNRDLFELLPMDAALIQCGRGEHLIEDDLRGALASGRVRGALMDVFHTEPLPPEHWMWSHPRIVVTPHAASETRYSTTMAQTAENIRRVAKGEAPLNVVRR